MISGFELNSNIVGMIIDEDLDENMIEELNRRIRDRFNAEQEISLFVELKSDKTISFMASLKTLVFKLKNSDKFRKIAFVGEVGWFKNLMEINDLFLNTEIRTFSNEERLQAITWISE